MGALQEGIIFSIIVPMYNAARYIEKCILSVEHQDFEQYECIFVNDGSTDNSEDIIKHYQTFNRRIKLVSQENHGASAARNVGIEKATGEYLIFLDADDELAPGALSLLGETLSASPNCEVAWNFVKECCTERSIVSGSEMMTFIEQGLVPYVTPWMMTVKRQFLLESHIFFINDLLSEDELFVFEVLTYANHVAIVPEKIYFYRETDSNSLSKQFKAVRVTHRIAIAHRLLALSMYIGDASRASILKARCAQLITGAIEESYGYRKESKYREIEKEIRHSLFMLKFGVGKRYELLYCMEKLVGNRICGYLMNRRRSI